jgi:hypothetical protein
MSEPGGLAPGNRNVGEHSMRLGRHGFFAGMLGVSIATSFVATALADETQWRKRHASRHVAHDIYVHPASRPSFVPNASANVGTEDRYSSDSSPPSFSSLGAPFTNRGFDLLPDRFSGPAGSLFQF